MWWLLAVVLVLVLGIIAAYKYYTGKTDYWPKKGVKLLNFKDVGTFKEGILMTIPFHEVDTRFYKKFRSMNVPYGGTEEFRKPTLSILDLDLIKHIMVKDFEFFVNRRTIEMQKKDKHFGDMMLIKENQEWKDLRSTMSPTFTTGKIKRMFEIFDDCGTKCVKFMDRKSKESTEMDLKDICGKYTMDVIASAAFGVDSKVFEDPNSAFALMGKRFQNNFNGLSGVLKLVFVMLFPKIVEWLKISMTDIPSVEFFQDIITKTRKHRQETGDKRDDFLQLMMEAQDGQLKNEAEDNETSEDTYDKDAKLAPEKTKKIKITDSIFNAQCLLFFIGGFDTTETLLIFAAYELAINPEVQDKLAKQVDDTVKRNNGKLTYEALNSMEYLDNVISETLRKYPPGFRTERKASFDYKIPNSDLVIPKDMIVWVPVYGIHYDPEYYPDPDKFDPERFNPENKASRHPYAYMPFGVGPRNCIAMRFALIQGKTAIAKLVQNFILEPCSKTHIPMKYTRNGMMKPDGGMWLNVKPRNRVIIEE